MFTIKSKNVVSIMKGALNCVDSRLVDHGAKVSYVASKIILYSIPNIDKKLFYDVCMLALFHDIGAYKTDEIDDLLAFDAKSYWAHSIYGYLFLYHMSPLAHLAEAVKLHHLPYWQYKCKYEDMPQTHRIALLLKLCDRVDVMLSSDKSREEIVGHFESQRDYSFPSALIDAFINADKSFDIIGKLYDKTYTSDSIIILQNVELPEAELLEYLFMLSLSIDFRSPYTVFHTITVVRASILIAKLMKTDPETISQIRLGSLLHDIGKMGIPVAVLEKPGALTVTEMKIMRSHIDLTRQLIEPYLDPVVCEMAARHHERLDGSGYPQGLFEGALTLPEQLIAVADVISALKGRRSYKEPLRDEAILHELDFQANKNKLSPAVIEVCKQNYSYISSKIEETIEQITSLYSLTQDEYSQITVAVQNGDFFSHSVQQNTELKPKGLLDLL